MISLEWPSFISPQGTAARGREFLSLEIFHPQRGLFGCVGISPHSQKGPFGARKFLERENFTGRTKGR